MLYTTKNVCYFMCEPLWASPYLVGLLWYALSCFRMCLYQAFLPCEKNKEIKTQAENSNFRHLFKDRIKSCYLWFRTSSQLSFNFRKKLCNHVMFATFKVWCTLLSALLSKYDKAGVIQRLQSNQSYQMSPSQDDSVIQRLRSKQSNQMSPSQEEQQRFPL